MKLLCHRPHPDPNYWSYGMPMVHDLGVFFVCAVAAWRWHLPLLKAGFLDAEKEGDVMFWRWDFWNAKEARWFREQRRKKLVDNAIPGTGESGA